MGKKMSMRGLLVLLAVGCVFSGVHVYGYQWETGIGESLAEARGHFFEAQSGMMAFSAMYELQNQQGIDIAECRRVVAQAVEGLQNARKDYIQLLCIKKMTYNDMEAVVRLQRVDYDGFCERYGLSPDIFKNVSGYMETGDIEGIYRHLLKGVLKSERILKFIDAALAKDQLPAVALVWEMNETMAETCLFGIYSARLLYHVR